MYPLWRILNGVPERGPLRLLGDLVQVIVGGGGAAATVGGVLTVNTTQTGTTAVTTEEEDLWTYSLPANTLSANGRALRITAFGTFGANANVKSFRVYFGATVVDGRIGTTANGAHIWTQAVVIRTGASAQLSIGPEMTNASVAAGAPTLTTPAADTTGTIVIKVTGQNGSAVANDIVFRGAMVEVLN